MKSKLTIGKKTMTVDAFQKAIFKYNTIFPSYIIPRPTLYERFFNMAGYRKRVEYFVKRQVERGQTLAKLSVVDYIDWTIGGK